MMAGMDTKTLAGRLNLAISRRKITQAALARHIGVTQQTIHSLSIGKSKKSKHLSEIARKLGVNAHWLLTGDGPMESNISEQLIPVADYLRLRKAVQALAAATPVQVEEVLSVLGVGTDVSQEIDRLNRLRLKRAPLRGFVLPDIDYPTETTTPTQPEHSGWRSAYWFEYFPLDGAEPFPPTADSGGEDAKTDAVD